jgi:hypothetical protein
MFLLNRITVTLIKVSLVKLIDEVSQVIEKIDSLHLNDPAIKEYWEKLAFLLTKSEGDTVDLLESLDDSNTLDNISSVFEEVSAELQSQKFIDCILGLERKFPELLLVHMIEAAKSVMKE